MSEHESDSELVESASASAQIVQERCVGRVLRGLVKGRMVELAPGCEGDREIVERGCSELLRALQLLVGGPRVREEERFAFAVSLAREMDSIPPQPPSVHVTAYQLGRAIYSFFSLYQRGCLKSPVRWLREDRSLAERLVAAARESARLISPADAADASAVAMFKFIQQDVLLQNPKAYVRKMATNAARDALKRRKNMGAHTTMVAEPDALGDPRDPRNRLPGEALVLETFGAWKREYVKTLAQGLGARLIELHYFDGEHEDRAYDIVFHESYPDARPEIVARVTSEPARRDPVDIEAEAARRHRQNLRRYKATALASFRRYLVDCGFSLR